MPELPEVETMVRGIRDSVIHHKITKVYRCPCKRVPISLSPSLRVINRRVCGHTVEEVTRLAKRVVLKLSSGDRFVIEPRMTGLMLLSDPPSKEHLRIGWQFDKSDHDLYFWDQRGLGTIKLLNQSEFETQLGPEKLGPDALKITPRLWQQRLLKTDREIKPALLDQKLVAGIGNLYASEILHVAGIHPQQRCRHLIRPQIEKLCKATRKVLNKAIRYEGSTLSDGTYRNALNKAGRYQNEHHVYQKQDAPCPTCHSGQIIRIVQAQRSTFFCPHCQLLK